MVIFPLGHLPCVLVRHLFGAMKNAMRRKSPLQLSRLQMFLQIMVSSSCNTANRPKSCLLSRLSFRHALFNGFLRLSDRSCWLLLIGLAAFSAWHRTRKYASRITVDDMISHKVEAMTGSTFDKGSGLLVYFRGPLDRLYPGCYAYTIQHF